MDQMLAAVMDVLPGSRPQSGEKSSKLAEKNMNKQWKTKNIKKKLDKFMKIAVFQTQNNEFYTGIHSVLLKKGGGHYHSGDLSFSCVI